MKLARSPSPLNLLRLSLCAVFTHCSFVQSDCLDSAKSLVDLRNQIGRKGHCIT
ncbi:hypothetical protein MC7420_8263 [Coleofasciculus chthonoplastes PCC 7420]|uniref:Uncharacterized protein n=1 Tax=Coleofasciculus chthonoplastes PCC 7420 TaxID=118168 RepID=B4W0Z6_9CYAN|nr:hypothetical protein MC7420_8263 [Coleofasciculus chthonoplastes PCC 7420]